MLRLNKNSNIARRESQPGMKPTQPRIIVLFGSPYLYGSERANIDVFKALQDDYPEAEVLFLTDKKNGHQAVHPHLEKLNLQYKPTYFHYRFLKSIGPVGWLVRLYEIFRGSLSLLWIIWRFRPSALYTSKEDYLLNFLPAVFLLRTPVVYRAGDSPLLHHKVYRLMWKYMAKRVQRFVCVSAYVQSTLVEAGVDPSKTEVIYSRPHKKYGKSKPKVERQGAYTVLFVGQIAEHKGLHLFVEAAIALCQRYESLEFLIAGKVDPEDLFAQEQIAKVKEAQLSDRIRFLGFVLEVDQLYAHADLHICPSVYEEPLANVLVDAKKYAIPSVIFPVGGLPEIIEHKVDGWICENKSAADLEKAVEYCLLHPDLCLAMGQSAKASLARLETDRFSQKWLEVFTQ